MSEVTDQELAQAFESAETPASEVETPEIETAPAVEEAPPVAEGEQPRSPVSLKDDDLIEIKIDGKLVQKPWREILQTQAMLPGAFTKKTQELAEQRRAVEAQAQQYEAYRAQAAREVQQAQLQAQQMQAYLRDPQKLAALYLAAQASGQVEQAPTQPQGFDPNQFRQQILGEAQQFVQQQLAAQAAAQQKAAAEQAVTQDITSYTSKLLEQQPVLASLEGIDDLIYGQVVKMRPTSNEEAKQFIANVVDGYAEKFKSQVTTAQKVAAVSAAKATNGIAPKGSAIPVPAQAKTYNKKKGLNDPALDADVMSYLNSVGG